MYTTTIPPFFRLSRELRDQIYHYALLHQRVTFTVSNLSLDVDYFESDYCGRSESDKNLRWLLASRQVLAEGLDQFYKHACLKSHYITRYGENKALSLNGTTSIFDLERVKSASLNVCMGKEHIQREGKPWDRIIPRGRELWDGKDDDFSNLGSVIKKMNRSAFEHLKLDISLFRTFCQTKSYEGTGNRFLVNLGGGGSDVGHDVDRDSDEESYLESDDSDDDDTYTESYWNGYGTNLSSPEWVGGYLADFEFLKNLGDQWKRVEIVYTPTYMLAYWGDSDPIPGNIVAVPIIQEGLAEAAKKLVGNKGWIVRDGIEKAERLADEWLLNAERRQMHERVCELKHVGLRTYLAECEGCDEREEKFSLKEEGKDGIFRFVGNCGHVMEVEVPEVGSEC